MKSLVHSRTVALLATVIIVSGCSEASRPTPAAAVAPVSNPAASAKWPLLATIDLGVVRQGQVASLNVWLKNAGKSAIQVSKIQASCECLELKLSQPLIEPGQRALAQARYDGAKEPDFVGSLQIEVELLDDKATKVGQVNIPIEVISAETPS